MGDLDASISFIQKGIEISQQEISPMFNKLSPSGIKANESFQTNKLDFS